MSRFRDKEGRPGPATWELGNYPEGQGDYPVTGVSWYEAAAYAEFAGKSLPTPHQWQQAANGWFASEIVPLSNFGGKGLEPVGTHAGMSPFGTYDMGGNAKEWCWNATGNKGFILGGAWNEPPYMFVDHDAQSPFDRLATYGFRCVKEIPGTSLPKAALEPISFTFRDYAKEKPASHQVFAALKNLYRYDPGPLDAAMEAVDEGNANWTKQKVSFNTAYGNERMNILRVPQARALIERLGYPSYFLVILGIWKLLGAVALAIPRFPRLKEWAYAGVLFDLTGAVASLWASGLIDAGTMAYPIVMTGVAVASWALRPPSRRLGPG